MFPARRPKFSAYIFKRVLCQFARSHSTASKTGFPNTQPAGIDASVPGLSSKCVKNNNQPVGPGAAPNAVYKVPEYFSYHRFSYIEAELELAKYRCQQPSALEK